MCLRGRVEAGFQVCRSCLCIILCLIQIIHKVPCPRCSDSLHSKRFQSSYSAKVGAFCSRPNTFPDELAWKRLLRVQASVRKDGKNYTHKGLNCKARKYDGVGLIPSLFSSTVKYFEKHNQNKTLRKYCVSEVPLFSLFFRLFVSFDFQKSIGYVSESLFTG